MKKITEVLKKLPHVHKFDIPMVADSTTEVWTDINTHLGNGDGWHLLHLDYWFENVTPTVPLALAASADISMALQVHRNTDNEVLLNANDDDVIMFDNPQSDTSASGLTEWPRRVQIDNVTTQKLIRVLFRTSADYVGISAATVQLSGKFYFHKLNGPKNAGFTKHGLMKEL